MLSFFLKYFMHKINCLFEVGDLLVTKIGNHTIGLIDSVSWNMHKLSASRPHFCICLPNPLQEKSSKNYGLNFGALSDILVMTEDGYIGMIGVENLLKIVLNKKDN
jgi:hypothetical protein